MINISTSTALWVFSPVKGKENPYRKPVSEMTYNVFSGTLNPAQPTTWRKKQLNSLTILINLATSNVSMQHNYGETES